MRRGSDLGLIELLDQRALCTATTRGVGESLADRACVFRQALIETKQDAACVHQRHVRDVLTAAYVHDACCRRNGLYMPVASATSHQGALATARTSRHMTVVTQSCSGALSSSSGGIEEGKAEVGARTSPRLGRLARLEASMLLGPAHDLSESDSHEHSELRVFEQCSDRTTRSHVCGLIRSSYCLRRQGRREETFSMLRVLLQPASKLSSAKISYLQTC